MERKIIGLMGIKGCGKSTLREMLAYTHDYVYYAFASPIREMLSTLLRAQSVSLEEIDEMLRGDMKETPTPFLAGRSPRHAMQTLGTEWGRELMGPAMWVDVWAHSIAQIEWNIVADDVRFPNEAAAIRALGGNIVEIVREGLVTSDTHVSEHSRKTITPDYTITNFEGQPEAMLSQLEERGVV